MFLNFVRFIRGYLRIKVSGYSPERFMNLCGNHEILIWDIEYYKEYIVMCVSIEGFFQLKPMFRKTKTRAVIVEKHGLPFFMKKAQRRVVFIIGLIACIIMLGIMSGRIWSIDISGNEYISTDVFMDFLEKNNVRYGMGKKELSPSDLGQAIRNEFEIVKWTSVKIDGTKLSIAVRENDVITGADNQPSSDKPSDFVTEKSGVVVRIITRSGIPLVKEGSEVNAGDVLVSGKIPIFAEDATIRGYQYCKADSDIYIRTNYDYKDEIPLFYDEKVYSGDTYIYPFVEILGKNIEIILKNPRYAVSDAITERKQVRLLDNLYLPIWYGTVTQREYEKEEKRYTLQQAKTVLNGRLDKFILALEEKGVEIIEKDVKIDSVKNTISVSGTITVIEKTGKSAVIEEQIADENS